MRNEFLSKKKIGGKNLSFFSLPILKEKRIAPNLERLPVSIRIVLESLLRNFDEKRVSFQDIKNLANYNAKNPGDFEIPFTVSRIILQDFTGVPLLVDLAAMRDAAKRIGVSPNVIEPIVPVDLVVDHSVQVDFAGSIDSCQKNMELEFIRNHERYEFLKWGQNAFETFNVVPPGIGIVHQVNLEYLAKGVFEKDGVVYPDTLVGTDSHTTMINGLGIVGWGVGGIEAEAGMLGQPVTFLVPEVVGVNLFGNLNSGVTATDLVLDITQRLRTLGVVGKFVEFFGESTSILSVPDRATIANMTPEYGATMGFFPIDDETIKYYKDTGRSDGDCRLVKDYYKAQGLFGIPQQSEIDYSTVLNIDLAEIVPCVSGPKRPQDKIELTNLKNNFNELFSVNKEKGGFGKEQKKRYEEVKLKLKNQVGHEPNPMLADFEVRNNIKNEQEITLRNGSVLIAAITSCTNTSNPSVMLAAGLVAKKINELGLKLPNHVKASLAPGSRVVTAYLQESGLQAELDTLGFFTVGYGCTTCIGNSGPLNQEIEQAINNRNLICSSVLSGNRNFEARVHTAIKANYLMSPPLVIAFALAGRSDIDLTSQALAKTSEGKEIFLKEIWPTQSELDFYLKKALNAQYFLQLYKDFDKQNKNWLEIKAKSGDVYQWNEKSTYIKKPPFFSEFSLKKSDIKEIRGARLLGFFGDSVTTDHISPAGAITKDSPAGQYLLKNGVKKQEFNSYGSRRGNDRVMTRGTFANVRIKNLMVDDTEGDVSRNYANNNKGKICSIFKTSNYYAKEKTPLIVIAGSDYGMGSSRDWAAKGTSLLGVRAVVAKSFERIHRSNLIGMGVMPLTFKNSQTYEKLKNDIQIREGKCLIDIIFLNNEIKPQSEVKMIITKESNSDNQTANFIEIPLIVRLDTPIEFDYYRSGGILQFVLAEIIKKQKVT